MQNATGYLQKVAFSRKLIYNMPFFIKGLSNQEPFGKNISINRLLAVNQM